MEEVKWRFASALYGDKQGVSSADLEEFKNDEYQGFVREILQNSIDAVKCDNEPVRVEFDEFSININDIPGIDSFKEHVENCKKLWSKNTKEREFVDQLSEELKKDEIACIRVSDYNTTGLSNPYDNSDKNKFEALAKGNGYTRKDSNIAAGSKGIGKNAAIIMSKFKMVFYSTNTIDQSTNNENCYCYMGVTKLISGAIEGSDDYTVAKGFYADSEKNLPIGGLIPFDNCKNKRKNESGTDIFIIDFEKDEDYESIIKYVILDSYMVAILKERLEISVNGIEINSSNILEIIDSLNYKDDKKEELRQQYLCLTSDDSKEINIQTTSGIMTLYLRKDTKEKALRKCVMVRYPFQKIKYEQFPNYQISAVCVLNQSGFAMELREIENAKHDNWEFSRIKDRTTKNGLRKEYNELKEKIVDEITKLIFTNQEDSIDPFGADQYIPMDDSDDFEQGDVETDIKNDIIEISTPKPIAYKPEKPIEESEIEQENGEIEDGGDDYGWNEPEHEEGGGIVPIEPSFIEGGTEGEGDLKHLKKQLLKGIKYKLICIDKINCKYKIVFVSSKKYDQATVKVSKTDFENNRFGSFIQSAYVNGKKLNTLANESEFGFFKIEDNKKVVIEITSTTKEYVSCEVEINAYI